MSKIPTFISIVLFIAGAAAVTLITLHPDIHLETKEYIQAITSIVATTGALISVTYVVSSYRQSIKTFHEAYRPQLLVQVENLFEIDPDSQEKIPVSIIHYRNISDYQFNSLTLHLSVDAFGKKLSLDDLFAPDMTMPGQDVRHRKIRPVHLLNERGIYLNTVVKDGSPPRLTIEYEYTYAGILNKVSSQCYIWNVKLQVWEIS
jgi:hypothetical protein